MASTTAQKMAPHAGELREDLEMACDESRRISMEIENLKSQLERKVKELGYCEEKKKLSVKLALKPKEMECLRKLNDELQAKNEGLQNNIVDMLENQIVAKKRHLLQLERLEIQLELQNMMELPNDWLQKGDMKLNKAGTKDKLFTDHSGDKKKVDKEKSKGFLEYMPSTNPVIGIKMMGQLAEDTFQAAMQRNHPNNDAETGAANMLEVWQENLEDPSWHPFKTVTVDGVTKEIIDRDDFKIQKLLWVGNDAYNAVTVALKELREYNPSGMCPVPELRTIKTTQNNYGKKITFSRLEVLSEDCTPGYHTELK
ncbi:hypothetical protein ACQ4PT_031943 [Festuca glaucescens]